MAPASTRINQETAHLQSRPGAPANVLGRRGESPLQACALRPV